jgi:2,4-didehydro-3-deoxy-L-rhamnonate hydrolase
MTPQSGDIISTRIPPGVRPDFKPPRCLKAGDIVELGIEALVSQRQVCIADD